MSLTPISLFVRLECVQHHDRDRWPDKLQAVKANDDVFIAAPLTVAIAHSDHVKWCADDWALVIAIRHRPLPAPGRLLERGVLPVGLGSQCEMYVRIGHVRSNTVYDPGDGIPICETDIWESRTGESLVHADRRLRRSDVAQRPRRFVNIARQ
jgi:hypothetical protein